MKKRVNDTDPVIRLRLRVTIGNFHGVLWIQLVAGFVCAQARHLFVCKAKGVRVSMSGKKAEKGSRQVLKSMPTNVAIYFLLIGVVILAGYAAELIFN